MAKGKLPQTFDAGTHLPQAMALKRLDGQGEIASFHGAAMRVGTADIGGKRVGWCAIYSGPGISAFHVPMTRETAMHWSRIFGQLAGDLSPEGQIAPQIAPEAKR